MGSGLLAEQFGHAVSSATLRNEMAALTKLGLLEQPHTSGRARAQLPRATATTSTIFWIQAPSFPAAGKTADADLLFREMDYDPERLAESAARALSGPGRATVVVATTPKSEDLCIAHL